MSKKILIVDDDMTFQKVMSDKLKSLNYEITSAMDGEEGLKMALEGKPDLVLLDIKMPKLDGIDFLKALKAKKDVDPISVLITSNLGTVEQISEGIALGVKGYIIKSNESLDTIVKEVEDVFKPTDNK